jgi:hypothetical protein
LRDFRVLDLLARSSVSLLHVLSILSPSTHDTSRPCPLPPSIGFRV